MLIWVGIASLLLTGAANAYTGDLDIGVGQTVSLGTDYGPDYIGVDGVADVSGTLNMYPGSYVSSGIYVNDGGALNMYAGTIGAGFKIWVFGGTVTVYGTDFTAIGGEISPDGTSWTPASDGGTLQVTYGDTSEVSLPFANGTTIFLAAPGTTNQPPVAIAGEEDVIGAGGEIHPIYSSDQGTTVVLGQASDPDDDDIEYRWLEGTTVLLGWTAVTTPPEAYLDLSPLPIFSAGDHTLTLEVRTVGVLEAEASDTMILRIKAAPEITGITIEPTELGSPTTVTATFSDPDGGTHTATVTWEEGGTPEAGVVDEGAMTVTGTTTYSAAGVYTVTVTVTDQNGGEASATAYAAVYDPDAFSFVSGAGWYDEELAPRGKAFLGFFVRQWGAWGPCGWMRLRWGCNRFRATSIDWLVVDESCAEAWFGGYGTINGAGPYEFMVEVGDDAVDIAIFDEYNTDGMVDLVRGRTRIRSCTW